MQTRMRMYGASSELKEINMRNRHSEDRQRDEHRPQPPAGQGRQDQKKTRSNEADVGAAPGQDEDSDVDSDRGMRDLEDDRPQQDDAPRVEPPRPDQNQVRRTKRQHKPPKEQSS